ncbi:MAG: hypothetical protein GQ583_06645 [Methyloprofundus sp.]|nr:hypothetical protein [Methyloprofundus sp.]
MSTLAYKPQKNDTIPPYRILVKYNTDTIPQRDVIRYPNEIYLPEKLYIL